MADGQASESIVDLLQRQRIRFSGVLETAQLTAHAIARLQQHGYDFVIGFDRVFADQIEQGFDRVRAAAFAYSPFSKYAFPSGSCAKNSKKARILLIPELLRGLYHRGWG